MRKHILAVSLASTLAVSVALYVDSEHLNIFSSDVSVKTDFEFAIVPDRSASSFREIVSLKNGTKYFLKTGRVEEYVEELGFRVLEDGQLELTTPQGKSWRMIAKEVTIYENRRLSLERDVTIQQLFESPCKMQMETQFVEIDLEQLILSTDQNVLVSANGKTEELNSFSVSLERLHELSVLDDNLCS